MRRLQLSLVFIILLSVLSSGCTSIPGLGGGDTSGLFGTGIEITALEPELTKVYSGESVSIAMKVKNRGTFDAKDGKVKLSVGDWDCTVQGEDGFDSLQAPDEQRGTEGQEKVFLWKCKAPQIDEGMTVPYEARGEVWYDYKSVTSKSVTLLPTADLIALRDAGQSLPSSLVSSSSSPVSISVVVEGPIRMMSETNGIEFPININIENAGGGVVEASKVSLDVEGLSGLQVLTDQDCDYADFHLWRGTSQKITCMVKAENVNAITDARLVATLTYGYTVSKTASIEVAGTRAAFG
jgi:hypothetical protein